MSSTARIAALVPLASLACGRLDFDRLSPATTDGASPSDAGDAAPSGDATGTSDACGAACDCETIVTDFEAPAFQLGSIHMQNGWSSLGASGQGCAVYDHEVAANTWGIGEFGGQSLRISNAVASGCFSDFTYTTPTANEVGETSAASGGLSGGTRGRRLELEWSFASAVPGAEQPGLRVDVSPDRGDGSRMSLVGLLDLPDGLALEFLEHVDSAPFGSVGNEADGCGNEDGSPTPVVFLTGLDRTAVHDVMLILQTEDGPRNDVVEVWLDGQLVRMGTSWEDYFRWCTLAAPPTVDSFLFRSMTAAPATDGAGFVIDNVKLRSCP